VQICRSRCPEVQMFRGADVQSTEHRAGAEVQRCRCSKLIHMEVLVLRFRGAQVPRCPGDGAVVVLSRC